MVKISKLELAVLLLTAAFLAFCAGWLLRGSGGSEPLRIESERTLAQPDEVVVLPAPTPEPTLSVDRPININTADSETLQLLPGIGEERAEDIIAYREEHGPFRIPEELADVSGIGEATLAGLIDYITVSDGTETEEEP